MSETPEPSNEPTNEAITVLLRDMHEGGEEGLTKVLDKIMPWLRQYVHMRVKGRLKAKLETQDVVQDAVANFLRDAPNFVVQGEGQFRAFLRQIADNVIRGHHRYFERQRRRLSRERPLSGMTQAVMDSGTPSQAAAKDEGEARVRLALEMMDPIEQRIICMKIYDNSSFREIGEELGMQEEATRQRYRRALPKLQKRVSCLEGGDIWGFLGDAK